MDKTEWILCPLCRNKTRNRVREDTVLRKYIRDFHMPEFKLQACRRSDTGHRKTGQRLQGGQSIPDFTRSYGFRQDIYDVAKSKKYSVNTGIFCYSKSTV